MILLKNGTFINWQTLEFLKADILVEKGTEGRIVINPDANLASGAEIIDCNGKHITKSFVVGHHHAYSALARGMNAPRKNPENFLEILQYIWWNLDKALDSEMVYYSGIATALACAKNGSTFVIDHHASPYSVKDSLNLLKQAFEKVGISHLLCYEISDRDGEAIARQGLETTEDYLKNSPGLVGLHASFTVGNQTLSEAVNIASRNNSGIHVHVAEDLADQKHSIEHYGKRVVERFADAGALQFPKTILAHCLHLDEHEKGLVKGSPVWVVQNNESNLNNSVGYFNSEGLGSRIMLGTDGMHSDMLKSAKSAFFTGHNFDSIDYPETYRRFRNAHNYLSSNDFEGDADNNLVILDYDTPTPLNQGNFLGHFLFGFESRHISHVISNGEIIVKNGLLTTINEEEALIECRKQAIRLWEKM
ncbi:MAG: amidohydrolase family protein [Bacteroidales bacterium]|nr:amidohydrolase family protein [Bacteroidales bacterium]